MLTRESLRIRVKTATKTLLQLLQCLASASDTQCELTTDKKKTHAHMSVFFLTVILLNGRESWVIYSSSTILPNSFVSPLQIRIIHLKHASYRTWRRCRWGIPSCGIRRCVIGYLVSDVSTKRTGLIKSLEVRTSRPLKMKTCSFEASGTDTHMTRGHIPEEWYPLISGSMKNEELDQLSAYPLLKVFIP